MATGEQKISSLFQYMEELHGNRPWGRLLDAGTGKHSLEWITRLATEEWTAVTASSAMARQIAEHLGDRMRGTDRLLVGNWTSESLLAGERFDTVLMDYLVGAIEGFAPYWQEHVFSRIRPLVSGRLYVTGLEPYVAIPADTEAGRIVCEIGQLRDACLLLAGERPYREYPLEWMLHQLRAAGFHPLEARRFPIIYWQKFVARQLRMCLAHVRHFRSPTLAAAMETHIADLHERAVGVLQREDGLRHGHDYVIAAEPAP